MDAPPDPLAAIGAERCTRRPVIIVIIFISVRRANIAIRPGGMKDVKPRRTGIEGIPGARIGGRVRPVQTAIGLLYVATARRGDCPILRPGEQSRMLGIGTVQSVISHAEKKRHGAAWHLPKGRTEDRTGICPGLEQIPIILLRAAGVAVISGGHRKARPARSQARHHIRLIGIGTGGIHIAPVAKDREREGSRGAHGHLCPEGGG